MNDSPTLERPAVGTAAGKAGTGTAARAAATDTRRLRLRHHVFFRRTEHGLHFDAGTQAFELKGRNLAPLVERVIAGLDAGTPVAELRARLPEGLRAWFDQFLATLQAHEMLLEERDAPVAPPELAEFVKHLQDQLAPEQVAPTWQRWRQATVWLGGRGHALKGALATLLGSGVGRVVVALQPGSARVDAAELQALARRWPASRVDIGGGAARAAAAEATALIVADDGDAALDAGQPATPAQREPGQPAPLHTPPRDTPPEQLLTPLLPHAGPDAVLALATHWRGHTLALALPAADARDAAADLAHALEPDDEAAPSAAALAIAGTTAAQALLRRVLGLAPAPARRVWRVTDHLEVQRLERVPAPGRAEPWRPELAAAPVLLASPSAPEYRTYETLRVALLPWLDPVLGAFEGAETEGLSQLPLYHETLRLRGAAGGRRVLGWGLDAREAGRRALAAGFEQHARLARPAQATRMACAFDEADWQHLALARALADTPAVRAGLRAWSGPAQAIADGDITLLGSLLGFLAPGPVQWGVRWHPVLPLACAWVHAGGRGPAQAVHASPRQALREALGLACSRLQAGPLPAHTLDAEPPPAAGLRAPEAADSAAPPPWDAPAAAAPAGVCWRRLGWPGLPSSVFVGHAEIDAAVINSAAPEAAR